MTARKTAVFLFIVASGVLTFSIASAVNAWELGSDAVYFVLVMGAWWALQLAAAGTMLLTLSAVGNRRSLPGAAALLLVAVLGAWTYAIFYLLTDQFRPEAGWIPAALILSWCFLKGVDVPALHGDELVADRAFRHAVVAGMAVATYVGFGPDEWGTTALYLLLVAGVVLLLEKPVAWAVPAMAAAAGLSLALCWSAPGRDEVVLYGPALAVAPLATASLAWQTFRLYRAGMFGRRPRG